MSFRAKVGLFHEICLSAKVRASYSVLVSPTHFRFAMARTKNVARKAPARKGNRLNSSQYIGRNSRGKALPSQPRKKAVTNERKPYRLKPGTKALREIRLYQGKEVAYIDPYDPRCVRYSHFGHPPTSNKKVDLLIPKLSFQRLVREIAQDIKSDIRVTVDALEALQTAAEAHLVQVFRDSYLLSLFADRTTMLPKDMQLAVSLRRDRIERWYDTFVTEEKKMKGYRFLD